MNRYHKITKFLILFLISCGNVYSEAPLPSPVEAQNWHGSYSFSEGSLTMTFMYNGEPNKPILISKGKLHIVRVENRVLKFEMLSAIASNQLLLIWASDEDSKIIRSNQVIKYSYQLGNKIKLNDFDRISIGAQQLLMNNSSAKFKTITLMAEKNNSAK